MCFIIYGCTVNLPLIEKFSHVLEATPASTATPSQHLDFLTATIARFQSTFASSTQSELAQLYGGRWFPGNSDCFCKTFS